MNLTKTPSPMNTLRTLHTATRFGGGGAILIAGGLDQNGNPLASVEIFYPATGVFVALAGALNTARYDHAAVCTPGGAVLIFGGIGEGMTYLDSVEIFLPGSGRPEVTGTFAAASGSLSTARAGMKAEMLTGGGILVTGGQDGSDQALALAEIYTPGI
jgi:Galactose oxidase, central domain